MPLVARSSMGWPSDALPAVAGDGPVPRNQIRDVETYACHIAQAESGELGTRLGIVAVTGCDRTA